MDASEQRNRSWWGWGWEDHALTDEECTGYAAMLPGLAEAPYPVPAVGDVALRPSRLSAPDALGHLLSDTPLDRAGHAYGKAYRDVIRALQGRVDSPPDLVARPATEHDVVDLLDWAASHAVRAA